MTETIAGVKEGCNLSTNQQISSSHNKEPKADPAPKAEPGPAPKPWRLTRKELQTLAQEKTSLVKLLEKVKLANHIAHLLELVEEIPKRYREALKQGELDLVVTIATVDAATESEICNYEELQKTICATRAAVIVAHAKIKELICDAEEYLGLDVEAIMQEKVRAADWSPLH